MNKDNLYLIDTNSLKDFINFQINKDQLFGWNIYCTSVQKIEITKTEDVEKRNNLLDIFQVINPELVTSPAGYLGLSMLDHVRLPTPENAMVLDQLKHEIEIEDQRLEAEGKKKKSFRTREGYALNRGGDAMVLQAALSLGPKCIVITRDLAMKRVCKSHSIQNAKPATFLNMIADNSLE